MKIDDYRISNYTLIKKLPYYKNTIMLFNLQTMKGILVKNLGNIQSKKTLVNKLLKIKERVKLFKYQILEKAKNDMVPVGLINSPTTGSDILRLIITFSTECNMVCSYCYEKGISPRHMSYDVCKSLIRWILNEAVTKKVSVIKIVLFGGEPLLAMDTISFFIQELLYALPKTVTVSFMLVSRFYLNV